MKSAELRRPVDAVLASLELDPRRRELYVEGPRDQQFLLWLVDDKLDSDVVIQTAEAIDVADSSGAKGRLLTFAEQVAGTDRIRYFVDADDDRMRGRKLPPNGWLTDLRDMEGYLIWCECPHKVLRIGLSRKRSEADSAFRQSLEAARSAGFLRYVDAEHEWGLPFQRQPPWRRARVRRGVLEFNERGWAEGLLDQSIGRGRWTEVSDAWVAARREAKIPDDELIHGKDFLGFFSEFLAVHGVVRKDGPTMVWAAFDRSRVRAFKNLQEVVEYLAAA